MAKTKEMKPLSLGLAKRLQLEAVPESEKDGDPWLLCTNGRCVVRVMREWCEEPALPFLLGEANPGQSGGYGGYHRAASGLRDVMPGWVDFVCPQAGGVLMAAQLQEPDGKRMPQVKKLLRVTTGDGACIYHVPALQAWVIRNFWPGVRFWVGPRLEGVDLFGQKYERVSPLIASHGLGDDEIVVGAIMLMKV